MTPSKNPIRINAAPFINYPAAIHTNKEASKYILVCIFNNPDMLNILKSAMPEYKLGDSAELAAQYIADTGMDFIPSQINTPDCCKGCEYADQENCLYYNTTCVIDTGDEYQEKTVRVCDHHEMMDARRQEEFENRYGRCRSI